MHTTIFECINKNGMSTMQEIMNLAGLDDTKTARSLLSDLVDQKMIQRKFDSGQIVYVANKKNKDRVSSARFVISDDYVFAPDLSTPAKPKRGRKAKPKIFEEDEGDFENISDLVFTD